MQRILPRFRKGRNTNTRHPEVLTITNIAQLHTNLIEWHKPNLSSQDIFTRIGPPMTQRVHSNPNPVLRLALLLF